MRRWNAIELGRHITGNYGEDQFLGEHDGPDHDPPSKWFGFKIVGERIAFQVSTYLIHAQTSFFVVHGIHGWGFLVKEEAVEPVEMFLAGLRVVVDFNPARGPGENS